MVWRVPSLNSLQLFHKHNVLLWLMVYDATVSHCFALRCSFWLFSLLFFSYRLSLILLRLIHIDGSKLPFPFLLDCRPYSQ